MELIKRQGILYILTGASGSGKTTLLNDIIKRGLAEKAPKFAERPSRGPDDDIIHVKNIEDSNVGCNIIYEINGKRYGVNTELIQERFNKGIDQFVILSDLRVVRRLKKELGDRVKSVYISSAIDEKKLQKEQTKRHEFQPTEEQKKVLSSQFGRLKFAADLMFWHKVVDFMGNLLDAWKDALPESKSYEIRAQKIRAFHSRYIDNIALFDHVILNYYEKDQMSEQIENLINFYRNNPDFKKKKKPVIFMVSAASGAGKGTLMESLNIMGSKQIEIVPKQGKRKPKENDKRDGMEAIENRDFSPGFTWRWRFHFDNGFKLILAQYLNGLINKRSIEKLSFHLLGIPLHEIDTGIIPCLEQYIPKSFGNASFVQLATELKAYLPKMNRGTEYAVNADKIQKNLDSGQIQIFISNMGQIEKAKERYGDRVVCLYLHTTRTEEDLRQFHYDDCKRDEQETENRLEEVKTVHQSYINNIQDIDHVLLNTTYEEDLYDQMFRLIEYYNNKAIDY